MESRLICISGPDGTGKSTQVELLIKSLKESGYKFEYRWLRFHHLISLPILVIARLFGLSEVINLDNGDKIGYHYFYKSRLISNLYKFTMVLDTFIFTIYKVYIPLLIFRKSIVCDRFIYDTIVDLMISTRDYKIPDSIIGKQLLALIPDRSSIIILIAEERHLIGRRVDLKHDKTLKQKIDLYQTISAKYNIPVIDASLTKSEVNRKIGEGIK